MRRQKPVYTKEYSMATLSNIVKHRQTPSNIFPTPSNLFEPSHFSPQRIQTHRVPIISPHTPTYTRRYTHPRTNTRRSCSLSSSSNRCTLQTTYFSFPSTESSSLIFPRRGPRRLSTRGYSSLISSRLHRLLQCLYPRSIPGGYSFEHRLRTFFNAP